jgi:hypothetical protein
MPSKRLSRRTVLRGLLTTGGAVAIPLPVLDIMLDDHGTAFAQGTPLARRYVTWFFGNGVLPPLWIPATTGAGWQVSQQLAPLAAVQNWLTVVSGLKQMIPSAGPHPTGSAAATTGANVANNSAQLKSIDQIVAGVNKGGSFASLEIGVSNANPDGPENTLHAISHRGPNAPNYPEFNPHALFARIFANATATTTMTASQVAKMNQAKKSILDAVLADGADVNKLLGAKDQARLADHLDAIRQIETRLETTGTTTTTIKPPADPQTLGVGPDTKSEAPVAVNEVMAHMLAIALATDVTRNASFVFTLPAAHVFYRAAGADMNDDFHNTICHTDPGDNAHQTRVHEGVLYAMTALSVFLGKLAAMPEGAATVLDNSLVYATSCTSWGKVHSTDEWPVLLAGRAGGAIKGNQHLRYAGQSLSNVLLSIANIFGANLTSIGLAGGMTSTELAGLRA